MKFAGLDISVNASGLFKEVDGKRSFCVVKGKGKEDLERYDSSLNQFQKFLCDAYDCVAIEDIFIHNNSDRDGATKKLIALNYLIRHDVWKRGKPLICIMPSVLKSFATGKGGADKPMMIRAACEDGFTTDNDNVADAYWLSKFAELTYLIRNKLPTDGWSVERIKCVKKSWDGAEKLNF